MASVILINLGVEGLTATLDLYTLTSDTAILAAIALTEKTNAKGWYTGTNTGTETGVHRIVLKIGSVVAPADSYVNLTNASPTEDIAGDRPNVGIRKNTALAAFPFFMVDSSDHISGKTGLTVTATRSIDGAAFAACANAATELSNGMYKIDLAAADLNGDTITLKFTATGADTRLITIKTTP